MKALVTFAIAMLSAFAFAGSALAAQAPVPLGNAAPFGALSATAMTNAGLDTVIGGNVGSSTSIDVGVTSPGFAQYTGAALLGTGAHAALTSAYLNAMAQPSTGVTGANLVGQTLDPGVYTSAGSILVSGPGALTLDGNGNADAVFIFQAAAAGDLTVDNDATVLYINGAQPCNVFWVVQSAFLSNTGFAFVGTILALTQITLTNNITVQGRLLARNADVTFIHDVVNVPTTCVSQASIDAAALAATAAAAEAQAATARDAAAAKDASDRAAAIEADKARDAAVQAAAAQAALVQAAADKAAADVAAAAVVKATKATAVAKAAAVKAKAVKAAATRARIAKAARLRAASSTAIALKRATIRTARVRAAFTG